VVVLELGDGGWPVRGVGTCRRARARVPARTDCHPRAVTESYPVAGRTAGSWTGCRAHWVRSVLSVHFFAVCAASALRAVRRANGKERLYKFDSVRGLQVRGTISKLLVVRFAVFMDRVVETLFCTECTECTRCATDTCGSGTKRSRGAPVTLDRESARVTVGSLAGARAGTGSACQAGAAAVFQGSAAPGMLPRPRPAWPSGACSTPRELHAISSPGSSRALIVSCYRQLARRRQDRSSYARISGMNSY